LCIITASSTSAIKQPRIGREASVGFASDSLFLAAYQLIEALIDHGIEVVYRPGLMRIPTQIPGGVVERYRDVGVRKIQYYNESNLQNEWNVWPGRYAPERFAEHYQHKIRALKSLGFTPVLAPLSPGGHILHSDFFARWMNRWVELGVHRELLKGCILGIHNRPITNDPYSNAICSFNEYKRWRIAIARYIPGGLPMIACEAGYEPSWVKDPTGAYNWIRWTHWNQVLISFFRKTSGFYVGDDFLYHIFWILDDLNGTWDECSLINNYRYSLDHGGKRTTALWDSFKDLDWPDGDNGNGGNDVGWMWVKDGLQKRGVVVLDIRDKLWKSCDQAECLRTRRKFHEVKGIVVHHSTEVRSGITDPEQLALYHVRSLGWKCPGYHVYISKDGLLTIVNRLVDSAPHSGRDYVDRRAFGVCFILDGTRDRPTDAQMTTFWKLLTSWDDFMTYETGSTRTLWILPHRFVVSTACPGDHLEAAILNRYRG